MKLILGSNSPRRRELLAGLDLEFIVDTENSFEEVLDEELDFYELPLILSRGKSLGFHRNLEDDELLITADTVVICEGRVLGKPHSKEDAIAMLRLLSGRSHEVVTGVCLRTKVKTIQFSDTTKVWFSPLKDEDIAYYLEKYKPYDKAGSYGIQEWIGYSSIEKIEGSFYNVMGFPVQKVWEALKTF